MTSESHRALLEQVVHAVVGRAAQVEWVETGDGWSAHARLQGASGRVSHVLTSPELQEARFEEPPCSVVIVTTTDEDEVLEALTKLARAALEYSRGGGHVERRRGLVGTRPVLVLRTEEDEWRIGKRSGFIPY
ncbi:hypothetical protein [Nostocoides sp. Soil756]|uniref:hypothetical protein n=1 Tax=Nostocoides sp. Soil756 TaxID=1736399 RepID=UPI0012F9DC26|nr:hypothetical protein [Tetrasphaera sp. Soil756]